MAITITDSASPTPAARTISGLSLVVSPSLAITNSPGTTANVGSVYTYTPTTSGGRGALTWAILNKPNWATFSTSTGVLTGTPTGAESDSAINITATDADGRQAQTGAFTITVSAGGVTYDGLVASRLVMPATVGNTILQMMSRSYHVATDDITKVKIAIPNFWVSQASPGDTELNNGGTAVVRASIEYGGAILAQFAFSTSPDTSGHPGDNSYGFIDVGGMIFSDYATITQIPKGDAFFIRIWFSSTVGIPFNFWSDSGSGDGLDFGSGISDRTSSTASIPTSGASFHPIAIIGPTTQPSVVLIGDSIQSGYHDAQQSGSSQTDVRIGVIQRGLPTTMATLNLGGPASVMETHIANSPMRQLLWPYCSHAVLEGGINDMYPNSRTATQVLGYNQAIAALCGSAKAIVTTITPLSTSTDGFMTVANQSIGGSSADTEANAYNATLRSSRPGWVADCLDICSVLESSLNSRKWTCSPSPPYTDDGTHPIAAGNLLSAGYVNSNLSKFSYP